MSTYVDILTHQFVDNQANLPLDWPAQIIIIVDNDTPVAQDWFRLTEEDYNIYITDTDRVARYNAALEYYNNIYSLKIIDILDSNFLQLPPDKIDFRRNLQSGVYLNKVVTMLKNGRPNYCTYEYNEIDYARIRFEFTTNTFNLVENKKSYLGYFNKNGTIVQEYLLTDEINDLGTIYGLQKAVKERYKAREYIFDEIKSYINAVILQVYTQQGKTYEEVLTDGGNFWRDYSPEISSWCHIGGASIITDKLNADTNYDFLDLPSGHQSMTIRQWIVDRITY